MYIKLTQNQMMSNQGIRSQTLYRSIDVHHVYHRAKFEFSSFSSLANMKGDGGRGASTQSNSIWVLVKIKLKQNQNNWSGNWS